MAFEINFDATAKNPATPTPPPVNPDLFAKGPDGKVQPMPPERPIYSALGAKIVAESQIDSMRPGRKEKANAHNKRMAENAAALVVEARNIAKSMDSVGLQEREDIRQARSKNAAKVFRFFESKLDEAMAMVVALMGDCEASATQLRAALEVIRVSALDVAETITNTIDLAGLETPAEKIARVNELYAVGVITAAEHGVLTKGFQIEAAQVTADLAAEVARLSESEEMRLSAEKAAAGRSN